MPSDEDLEQRVIAAVRKIVAPHEVTVDTSFDAIGVDSLTAIEILFEVEEEFDIDIPNDAAKTITNVRGIIGGVQELLAAKG